MFVEHIVYMTIHSPSDYDLSGVHPLVQFHHTLIEIHPYLNLQCACVRVCRSTNSCKGLFHAQQGSQMHTLGLPEPKARCVV